MPRRGNIEVAKDTKGTLLKLAKSLKSERWRILAVLVVTLGAVLLTIAGPYLLGMGTNTVIDGIRGDGVDYGRLLKILGVTGGCYIVAALLRFLASYIVRLIVQDLGYRMRREAQAKIDRMPLTEIDKQQRGNVLSTVTNDIDNVVQSLLQTLSEVITAFYQVLGIIVIMLFLSWSLTVVSLVAVPVGAFVVVQILKHSKKQFRRQWNLTADVSSVVEESFTGLEVVAAYGLEDEFEKSFDKSNNALFDAGFKAQAISQLSQPTMTVVANVMFVIATVMGGLQAIAGVLTIGGLQAFLQYSRQLSQPIQSLASTVNLLQSAAASQERIFAFMAEPEMTPDSEATYEDLVPAENRRGQVTFEHVSFGYEPGKKVIHDLSFTAQPGQTVAIVGPTGAGKTTIVNLLMRFYEVDSGRILTDGVDIRDFSKDSLRSHIGMVLQETWLFADSIWRNIAFGRDGATKADAVAAAKAIGIDRFIRTLPGGYDSQLGTDGDNISAGEKQLLTIARAYLADPDILILDEATSSVDTRTEQLIQKAMGELRTGRTSFIIAHRLSTIVDADVILVMEHGNVVEQGTHHELLEKGGAYARLYASQFA
ncbi:ABC transporter [Actinobaculum suis]|uniref:Fatty acid ABC transporter ATP-binding/permease protein n=1 Tax=Actinobaculum suis TaxID=1657 RepID=A0A0K9ERR4_9ACTO|nr:ABC transporter ATP-binding protein [Actinobaculum suis]KMY22899.1 ABC transporter ATP-binding protein [Actinobaculum suis]OCA93949.1 ABC transporter ATP-binding protein [Actinobaculum suis]OCA94414.1 ABC transporter ATP-binding protein [Actinobaculum suis]VDG76677.1 ABC transporter [Actinobaculum suis]